MANITHFVRTTKGGVLYKNASGVVVAAGSPMDKAKPDINNPNGIVIMSGAIDNTYYAVANGLIDITLETPAGTVVNTLTRDELLTALSEDFFFLGSSGGGGISDAVNGLYLDGTTLKMGFNPLIEETQIDEQDYQFLQFRTAVLNAAPVVAVSLTEKLDLFDTGNIGLLRGQYVEDDFGARAITGVFGDNVTEALAFQRTSSGDYIGSSEIRSTNLRLSITNLGVVESEFKLDGVVATMQCNTAEFTATTAFRVLTPALEIPLASSFVIGESSTDGSFRFTVVAGVLLIQKRVAGVWVTLGSF